MQDTKKQYRVREILRTYLVDDCLKPQYDGMTAWEIAGKVVSACDDNGFKIETTNETRATVDAVLGVGDEKQIRN